MYDEPSIELQDAFWNIKKDDVALEGYPAGSRRQDLEMLGQTDRVSDQCETKFTTSQGISYFEEILSEAGFMFTQYQPQDQAKIKQFTQDSERCLPLLQRAIQCILHHSNESRTYVLQGVYDITKDKPNLKLALKLLEQLASYKDNPQAVTSLVYAVFVCSHVQVSNDQEYTHYWLLRYDLHKGTLECFDSYSALDGLKTCEKRLRGCLQDVIPADDWHFQSRATHHYPNLSSCFWNLCKDLICLTAFRNCRVLRRGKEQGFSSR